MIANKKQTNSKRKIKLHGEPPAKKRKVDHELKIDTLVELMPEFGPLKSGVVPPILYGPLQKLITQENNKIKPENSEMENRKNNLEKLHNTIRTIKFEEKAESKVKNYKDQIYYHQVLSKKTTIQKAQSNISWKDLLFLVLPYEHKVKYLFSYRAVCRAWNESIQPHLTWDLMKKHIISLSYYETYFKLTKHGKLKGMHYAFAHLNLIMPDEVGKDYRLFHKKLKQIKERKHAHSEVVLIYLKHALPQLSNHYQHIQVEMDLEFYTEDLEKELLEQLKKPWTKNFEKICIDVDKERTTFKADLIALLPHATIWNSNR